MDIGVIELPVVDYYVHKCNVKFKLSNTFFEYDIAKHGANKYNEIYFTRVSLFLEPRDIEIKIKVSEMASFLFGRQISRISYPNKKTNWFVNICGAQDDLWDYVYNDKSFPQVVIRFNNNIMYNTTMTGAYKRGYCYYSDKPVTDELTFKLEALGNNEYYVELKDFKRYCPGRIILRNIDYVKKSIRFKSNYYLGGTDYIGHPVKIRDNPYITFECYTRVGRAANVSYSAWPYCHTYCYADFLLG